MRFEVAEDKVVRDVQPCHWSCDFQHFERPYCLHLQYQAVHEKRREAEELLDPDDEGSTVVRNTENHTPANTASHLRRLLIFIISKVCPLEQPKIFHI
jgi:hypothetical protein